MLNRIYVSRKSEDVTVKVISENEDHVVVEVLTGPDKGSQKTFSLSTMKRWYKEVVDTVSKEVPVIKKREVEVKVEEEEVKKPVKQEKKSESKPTTSKIDRTKEVEMLKQLLTDNYTFKYYESVNAYMVSSGGKTIAEIRPQRKILCVCVKNENHIPQGLNYKGGYKYFLPVRVDVPYEPDFCSVLKEILG